MPVTACHIDYACLCRVSEELVQQQNQERLCQADAAALRAALGTAQTALIALGSQHQVSIAGLSCAALNSFLLV